MFYLHMQLRKKYQVVYWIICQKWIHFLYFFTFKFSTMKLFLQQSLFSANVLISEVLPRSRNLFPGSLQTKAYLDRWNRDASELNYHLRKLAVQTDWICVIQQSDFHTLCGKYDLHRSSIIFSHCLDISNECIYGLI